MWWWSLVGCVADPEPGSPVPPPVDEPQWAAEPIDDQPNGQIVHALLPTAEPLHVACTLISDPAEVHRASSPADRLHELTLYGLLADEDYDCALTAGPWSGGLSFRTPPLPDDLPSWSVSGEPFDGYLLLNHGYTDGARKTRLLIVDGDGRLRWSRRVWENPPDVDAQYLGEGQILFGGGFGVVPTWIDLSGRPLLSAPPPSTGEVYHHHVERIDTGEVMTLALATVDDGDRVFADYTIEMLDPSLTRRTWLWESARGRQEGWLPEPRPDQEDPYHANALGWADGDVFVAMRHQHALVRLDRETGDRVWTLGVNGDFTLLDQNGDPAPDSQWFYGAHAPELHLPRILFYDNGWQRPDASSYSRLLELELDEDARTARVVWTWTEPGWYEPIWGDVDRLPNGHVQLVRAHCGSCKPGQVTEVVEVDPETDEVVWRLTYATGDDAGFRAERIDGCALFANERYCPPSD